MHIAYSPVVWETWYIIKLHVTAVSYSPRIIRPHHSTTHTYMRPIVTDRLAWSVGLSVCRSVIVVSPAKTAESIEMPFGWVGQRNHVLDGFRSPQAKGQFLGERTCPVIPNGTLPWAAQKWQNQ